MIPLIGFIIGACVGLMLWGLEMIFSKPRE